MPSTQVPFQPSLFTHAMHDLLGRKPDHTHRDGHNGYYRFLYEPRNAREAKKFEEAVQILREWLGLFEILPFTSRCDYGFLPQPSKDQMGKRYLDICITFEVRHSDQEP